MINRDIFDKMNADEKYEYAASLNRALETYRRAYEMKSDLAYYYSIICGEREKAVSQENVASAQANVVADMEAHMKDIYGEKGETEKE